MTWEDVWIRSPQSHKRSVFEGCMTCLPVTGQAAPKVIHCAIENGDSLTACEKETMVCSSVALFHREF